MKNKFACWGLLGLIGVAGIILKSTALSGLVLLFLLFFTAAAPVGDAFRQMVAVSGKRAFIVSSVIGGVVFLIASVLTKTTLLRITSFEIELMLYLSALIAGYLIGILVFTVSILIGSVKLKKSEEKSDRIGE